MDDAQIADVVITANNIAIKAGKLAQSRSSNPNIKAMSDALLTSTRAPIDRRMNSRSGST
jgi:predicted outer membrane protein